MTINTYCLISWHEITTFSIWYWTSLSYTDPDYIHLYFILLFYLKRTPHRSNNLVYINLVANFLYSCSVFTTLKHLKIYTAFPQGHSPFGVRSVWYHTFTCMYGIIQFGPKMRLASVVGLSVCQEHLGLDVFCLRLPWHNRLKINKTHTKMNKFCFYASFSSHLDKILWGFQNIP